MLICYIIVDIPGPQVLEKQKSDLKQPHIAVQIYSSMAMFRILWGIFKHSTEVKGWFCRVLSAFSRTEAKELEVAQCLLEPPL